MKNIKSSFDRNPAADFVIYFVVFLLTLCTLFYFGLSIPKTDKFQDIGDLLGSTIGIAVSFAGSIVAIVLAIIALKMGQNQHRRELYDSIKVDIAKTFDASYKVVLGYTKIRYESYQALSKIQSIEKEALEKMKFLIHKELIKTIQEVEKLQELRMTTKSKEVIESIDVQINNYEMQIQTSGVNDETREILKKVKIPASKEEIEKETKEKNEKVRENITKLFESFAQDIHSLREDYFIYNAYINNFQTHKEFEYCKVAGYSDRFKTEKENFYVDPLKITEMSLQITEYSDYFFNAVRFFDSNIDSNTKKVPLPENINMVDYFSLLSIGYCSGALQGKKDNKEYLVNTMVILDILYNIPDQDDIKDVLAERQFDDNDKEFLNEMLNNPVCQQLKEFKEEINKLRSFVHNDFEKLFVQRV